MKKTAKDYLKGCIDFEIEDPEINVTNGYLFISYRWIRQDDNQQFLPAEMEGLVDAFLNFKDKKFNLSFYGKHIEKVTING